MRKEPEAFAIADPSDAKSSRRPNPIDAHVGGRVRLRRMWLGLSQEKLGEKLGLTFQQIQKYEKGVNRIGASRLYDLSRVLGVGVEYFFEEFEDDPSEVRAPSKNAQSDEESVSSFLSSREGIDLNRAVARIRDTRVRRSLIELARVLADDENARP